MAPKKTRSDAGQANGRARSNSRAVAADEGGGSGMMFALVVIVLAAVAALVFSRKGSTPSWAGLSFNEAAGDAFVRAQGVSYSNSKVPTEIKDISRALTEGEPIVDFGSRRIFLRVLLLDATPESIDSFLQQVRSYTASPAHCTRFLGDAEHKHEQTLAAAFHPDTDAAANCRSAIVVEPDVTKAPPAYYEAVYKGLMEGEGYIQGESMRTVTLRELQSSSSKIMFVVGLPSGTDVKNFWSGRVLQMFTHRISLKRA